MLYCKVNIKEIFMKDMKRNIYKSEIILDGNYNYKI